MIRGEGLGAAGSGIDARALRHRERSGLGYCVHPAPLRFPAKAEVEEVLASLVVGMMVADKHLVSIAQVSLPSMMRTWGMAPAAWRFERQVALRGAIVREGTRGCARLDPTQSACWSRP